jgi:hypothetical protein
MKNDRATLVSGRRVLSVWMITLAATSVSTLAFLAATHVL